MRIPARASFVFGLILGLPWIVAPDSRGEALLPPNVILMMADDMGMGDTSAYQDFTGNADAIQVATPQMERLARMGMRFMDAHTPSSRCSPTRYGLMTGRYPWRNRLKYWVLYGSQGDPMIEADRPTLATLFKGAGYGTAMVGKWHVGLRYSQSDGRPAAGWEDADLTQPLHTTPLDHGFDFVRFTSRSHATSGPDAGAKTKKGGKRNSPQQNVGPGHIHGRIAVGATGEGKQLVGEGKDAYVLTRLGSRHSDHAMGWLEKHLSETESREAPFFLYYPSNSNHGPYTPDKAIGGVAVAGASRTKSGDPMDKRHDYIYENDVALGRMLDFLEKTDDPRRPGHHLIENTIVIFTSDNGAEVNTEAANGPFRSNKGSVYEGGHRVPFLVAWPAGGVGDGKASTEGRDSGFPIGLQDLYATFAEVLERPLPDLAKGEKGAEDSFSVLSAWRGTEPKERPPLFFNDHKESKEDAAVAALRVDDPLVEGKVVEGAWKVFFEAPLLRQGKALAIELYDLRSDQLEADNRVSDPALAELKAHLSRVAEIHRNSGGHRYVDQVEGESISIQFASLGEMAAEVDAAGVTLSFAAEVAGQALKAEALQIGEAGLGVSSGGEGDQDSRVGRGEAVLISFDQDVVIESVGIRAGNDGACGGFYRVGNKAPLAIYCVDADNDAKDQQGLLSDIGTLKAGEVLRLDSSPHYGVEAEGDWVLETVTFRKLRKR